MSEHGTRSDFIKNVSERLLTKVNEEARDLTHANQLFASYMQEFCDEYDRCGYGNYMQTKNNISSLSRNSPSSSMASDN